MLRRNIGLILFALACLWSAAGCASGTTAARKVTMAVATAQIEFYEGFPAWDARHQQEFVDRAKSVCPTKADPPAALACVADAEAAVAAYRKVRDEKVRPAMSALANATRSVTAACDLADGGAKVNLGALVAALYNAGRAVAEALKLIGYELPLLKGVLLDGGP